MLEGVSVVLQEMTSQFRTPDTIQENILKKKDSLIPSYFFEAIKKFDLLFLFDTDFAAHSYIAGLALRY